MQNLKYSQPRSKETGTRPEAPHIMEINCQV
jgi:hypothetical protein